MNNNPVSASAFKNGDEVFFVLKNGNMCSAKEAQPSGFFVKGQIREQQFVPVGNEIIGDGNLAEAGHGMPGWYELNNGKFYAMQTARAPTSPYVNGFMTSEGFLPSSRQIH